MKNILLFGALMVIAALALLIVIKMHPLLPADYGHEWQNNTAADTFYPGNPLKTGIFLKH